MSEHPSQSDAQRGDNDEFVALAMGHLDGLLNESQVARLNEYLRNAPERRHEFVDICLQARTLREIVAPVHSARQDEESVIDHESRSLLESVLEQERVARIKREAEKALAKQQQESRDAERRESMRVLMGLSKPQNQSKTKHYVIPKPLFYGSIAAAVAILALIILPFFEGPQEQPVNNVVDVTPERPVVAKIGVTVNAVWANNLKLNINTQLRQGDYELRDGLAKIVYENGVEVIIEAPSRFTLDSQKRLRLHDGKLVGLCPTPQSKGFTVIAPNAQIVDLGTEFGVAVDQAGETITEVFIGEIEVAGMTNGKVTTEVNRVRTGQAKTIDATGSRVEDVTTSPLAFVRSNELEVKLRARQGSAIDRWLAYQYELHRKHESLVAHYVFDEKDRQANRLINRAPITKGKFDGILGQGVDNPARPRWRSRQGRFAEKPTMEFGQAAGGLHRSVVVRHDPALDLIVGVTLATWLKVDEIDGGGTILSKRDTPADKFNFQFSAWGQGGLNNQSIQFGCGNDRADSRGFRYSDPVLQTNSKWRLLVATYDNETVHFYIDGKPVSSTPNSERLLASEGDLLIGISPSNLIFETGLQHYEMPFEGLIDEVMIFSEALSAEDIAEMYEAGRPE